MGKTSTMRALILAAALAAATSLPAFAVEQPTSAGECLQLLENIEVMVEEKALDGDIADAANELLLALDRQCNDANYSDAQRTADELTALVERS